MEPAVVPFDRYELLAQIATGGMAEIWLARTRDGGPGERPLVVKRLHKHLARDPEFVQMFLDEGRINAALDHANVVRVLRVGEEAGRHFMVLEWVPGVTLAQAGRRATQRLGQVPQEFACGSIAQACAGLHHAHEQRQADGRPLEIIHRDLSPYNLLCTFDGVVKVVDFGIAMAEGRESQTRTGFVKGTYAYMSPEQCQGRPLDRRSDLFSLGIVLYELTTSRRLFHRKSPVETFDAIAKGAIPPPRNVNGQIHPAVQEVIVRALERRPEDRFSSASEMQLALEAAMGRAQLDGSPLALARMLGAIFPTELAAQQTLIARTRGEIVTAELAPLLETIAAGLDGEDAEELPDLHREAGAGGSSLDRASGPKIIPAQAGPRAAAARVPGPSAAGFRDDPTTIVPSRHGRGRAARWALLLGAMTIGGLIGWWLGR